MNFVVDRYASVTVVRSLRAYFFSAKS